VHSSELSMYKTMSTANKSFTSNAYALCFSSLILLAMSSCRILNTISDSIQPFFFFFFFLFCILEKTFSISVLGRLAVVVLDTFHASREVPFKSIAYEEH